MPRPTPAQLVYGSATVVLSTLAMLLLSGVDSGVGVVVIAIAGLALGVLVAVTLAMPWPVRGGRPQEPADGNGPAARPERDGQPRAERLVGGQSLRR